MRSKASVLACPISPGVLGCLDSCLNSVGVLHLLDDLVNLLVHALQGICACLSHLDGLELGFFNGGGTLPLPAVVIDGVHLADCCSQIATIHGLCFQTILGLGDAFDPVVQLSTFDSNSAC